MGLSALLSVPLGVVPSRAWAAGPMTPDEAAKIRRKIHKSLKSAEARKRWKQVADELEARATRLGDPVMMVESAEARLKLAQREQSLNEARHAEETTRKALDIAYFYRDVDAGKVRSLWLVLRPGSAERVIARANENLQALAPVIAGLSGDGPTPAPPPQSPEVVAQVDESSAKPTEPSEADEHADDDDGDDKAESASSQGKDKRGKNKRDKHKRDKSAKPGTGLVAGGVVFTVLGVGGGALAATGLAISSAKQNEVEELDRVTQQDEIRQLDDEGAQANLFGYIGLGVAAAGLAIGVPMLVVGARRRKGAVRAKQNAQLRWAPHWTRDEIGVAMAGRF